MPDGYLVTLGDGSLDTGDGISGGLTTFTTDTVIGSGQWEWSGTWNGSTFSNTTEPGDYILATNGNVYFVPAFGPVDTLTSASVVSAPGFTAPDGIVQGTSGDDLIDPDYSDGDGDAVDRRPDDAIEAGAGQDTVIAGIGDDTVSGGAGNDLIYGDFGPYTPDTIAETLQWTTQGGTGTDLSGGFTQDTGNIDVTLGFADPGDNAPTFEVDDSLTQYSAAGETFDPTSSLFLFGQGDGVTSATTMSFAASAGASVADEVTNVAFRINDIDFGTDNHTDIVTVNAFDAEGNPVAVTLTPGGGDAVSGNTITAENLTETSADAGGSVLVEIAGPVASIQILYGNLQGNTQGVWVTDVQFDAVPIATGNDSLSGDAGNDTILGAQGDDTLDGGTGSDVLDGGLGADVLLGGDGDDVILAGQGDTIDAGDGDDTIRLVDLGEPGAAGIVIEGRTGGQTGGDTLDLDGLADRTTLNITSNIGGELSGTVQMLDGSLVTFSNIDDVICFTPGTRLLTDTGYRPIESLRAGDLLMTRDDGLRPLRWIGARSGSGLGRNAPIRIAPHIFPVDPALKDPRGVLVSPQHRMLMEGYEVEMLFGTPEVLATARHLENGMSVAQHEMPRVTYIHLALDRHQVIYAEGVATESFFVGDQALRAMTSKARARLFAAMPHLRSHPAAFGPTARHCLKRAEAKMLLREIQADMRRAA